MGILQKAFGLKYERGANYELGNSLSSHAVGSLFGSGGSKINVLDEYMGYAWKFINIRADMLSDQDLFVQRQVGDKWQEDPNHEFNLVLEGGDGGEDQSELLEAHSKSMDLYGEAFWYFSKREGTNKPHSIYILDPSAMTVLVADNRVTGYAYQKDTQRAVFDLDEIKHHKIHNPANRFRGMGPMQAAGWFVRSARYNTTYMNNFLENNAMPAGVVVAKGPVNDTDWKLFQAQWMDKHSGIDNIGKTGFVRGQDLDFVKTGLSLGDVDFEKMTNSTRGDIAVMFGISKPMMAIFDDINRASAVTARQLFALTITSPQLRRLERKLTKKVAKWYGKQYRVQGTDPVPEDREAKLMEYDKGVGRWLTVNEARAAYGLEAIPGGEVLSPTLAPKEPTKSLGKVIMRTKNHKAEFSYEMKESFRSEGEDIQVKHEQKLLQATNRILKEQKDMVLDQIHPKKLVDAHINVEDEAKKLADETIEVFISLAKAQGVLAATFVGNADSKFELTDVMRNYIRDSIYKASLGFTKETLDKIVKEIADGVNAGEGLAKIGKRINSVYDEVLGVETPGYRIERLARTEVIKLSNEITEAAYRQSGVVQKKEWFANPGHCEFCASLNGSVISLGAAFVSKGATIEGSQGGTRLNDYEDIKHAPVHPSCRCVLIPVVEDI